MQIVRSRKVLIALIFAIFMTGFFWITANSDPASAITVTVQAEDDQGNFILAPTSINVSAGYAATIDSSYTNTSPATSLDVTALDVLFAAHTQLYGSSFNSDTLLNYIDGSASYITKMFEISAGEGYGFPAIMFAVNGMQPRDEEDPNHQFEGWGAHGPATGYWTYAMNQSILDEGDIVNFFFVNSYNDLYAFINDGTDDYLDLNPLQESFDVSDTLYIKGYDYFNYGYLEQSGWDIVNIANAAIYRASDGLLVGSSGDNGLITINANLLSSGTNSLIIKPSDNSAMFFVPIYLKVIK